MNKPFVHYQIEGLLRAGIEDVVLSLNYHPEKIEAVLGQGSGLDAKLRFVTEPTPLGTAGAFRYATEGVRDTTVVLNGDIFTDVEISRIVRFHRQKGAKATIALYPVPDPSSYGVVVTDRDDRVMRFVEKPSKEEAARLGASNINAGIYVLEPEILNMIAPGVVTSFEYDVFPHLLSEGLPFYGYVMSGNYWRDIGSPQSYLAAHLDFLSGAIKLPETQRYGRNDGDRSRKITRNAVISEHCVVSDGARVVNSVLGPGTHVDESAVIENSVVWSNSMISASAEIKGSVIGDSCHIGRNVSLNNGVLGERTFLADYSRLHIPAP